MDKIIIFGLIMSAIIFPSLGYLMGDYVDHTSIITLSYNEKTLEIYPVINGEPIIDCPEGYNIMAVGYYDDKLNYRCSLIMEYSDCQDSEFYLTNKMMCVSKTPDNQCGDKYFLDSPCHNEALQNFTKVNGK